MLLAASQISPVYNLPYVAFCLPAVALLAGTVLAILTPPWRATALAAAAALTLPGQLAIRAPGSALQGAAHMLAAHEHPGDAVIYPASGAYPRPSIPADNLAYPTASASCATSASPSPPPQPGS
jgi:mannosyltransferase